VERITDSTANVSQLEYETAQVWTVEEDMALTNDQLGQRMDKSDKALGKLGERIAAVEGRLSASPKQTHPVIITLVSVFGVAILGFWGWMATGVVSQGNRLTGIETTLRLIQVAQAPKRVLQEIAKLDNNTFRKIAERKPADVAPSRDEIQDVAGKLQNASVDTPDYWPTVLQFLNFSSAAMAPPNVPASDNSATVFSNSRLEGLIFKNQVILLDGGSLIHTRLENSRIIFTESPVDMKSVQFVNCIFEFPIMQNPSPYLKKASRQLLASNLATFSPSLP
jgi:hypothetical protein